VILATGKNLKCSDGVTAMHLAYMRSLQPKQKSAESMSLSGWRKDYV
jgi:hypothetical protein